MSDIRMDVIIEGAVLKPPAALRVGEAQASMVRWSKSSLQDNQF